MDPAGFEALQQLITSFIDTSALMAAAEVGLADHLGAEARPAGDVAAEMGVDPDALRRLLRVLSATGAVAAAGGDSYRLAPMGEWLRSDTPGSQRSFFRMIGNWLSPALLGGKHTLATGEPAFEAIHGLPAWQYLEKNPEAGAVFNAAMVEFGGALGTPALHTYDWSGVQRLIDVGGGRGQLVREVLRHNPGITGTILDQPHVIAEAQAAIAADGLAERCRAVGGDFFTAVPAGDCYSLRWIIHDWNDVESVAILSACRAAIEPGGRLLLFEVVMPGGDGPHLAKTLDWIMLTCITGKERTEAEYGALLAQAGFRLERVIPSPTPMSVLEAFPV